MFIYHKFFIPTVAVVGLSQTLYTVAEEDLQVEVCVVVTTPDFPDEGCPIASPFNLDFSTVDGTAGK